MSWDELQSIVDDLESASGCGSRPIQATINVAGGGGDKTYKTGFTSSAVVTVNHGLNKEPAVTIKDSAGDEVEGHVNHVSPDQLIIYFTAPFTGTVTCN
jgi:hypothetical protein